MNAQNEEQYHISVGRPLILSGVPNGASDKLFPLKFCTELPLKLFMLYNSFS